MNEYVAAALLGLVGGTLVGLMLVGLISWLMSRKHDG